MNKLDIILKSLSSDFLRTNLKLKYKELISEGFSKDTALLDSIENLRYNKIISNSKAYSLRSKISKWSLY